MKPSEIDYQHVHFTQHIALQGLSEISSSFCWYYLYYETDMESPIAFVEEYILDEIDKKR